MRVLTGLFVLALVCGVWSGPEPVVAAEEGAAAQRINLAGRQRMLTQRMAAASCLAMAGVGGAARQDVARQAHDEFSVALAALQNGNPGLGLGPETEPTILNAFAEVAQTWSGLGPAVLQLAHGDQHSVVVAQLLDLNLPALVSSNTAVQHIVQTYGGGGVDPAVANAIDVAGRQRMLSQRMMKEACFVVVGLAPERSAAGLADAMSLFDRSLADLRRGNPDLSVAPPPSPGVSAALSDVARLWETYAAALRALEPAEAGQPVDASQLEPVAILSDRVLAASHAAVIAYVESQSPG